MIGVSEVYGLEYKWKKTDTFFDKKKIWIVITVVKYPD